jgi:hypothetical protein
MDKKTVTDDQKALPHFSESRSHAAAILRILEREQDRSDLGYDRTGNKSADDAG